MDRKLNSSEELALKIFDWVEDKTGERPHCLVCRSGDFGARTIVDTYNDEMGEPVKSHMLELSCADCGHVRRFDLDFMRLPEI